MMRNIAKDTIKKTRDRALSSVIGQVSALNTELASTRGEIAHLKDFIDRNIVRMIPISDKLIIVKMFSGLKICLDPTDVAVVPHLALDGIWEESTTRAWLSVLKPNQVVLDIGANFGYYGALAAQRSTHPDQKVVFFEANPDLIPYIDRTLATNGLNRQSRVENVGIADKKGTATLTILEDFIGCSSLHSVEHLDTYLHGKMKLKAAKKVKVNTVAVDDYCAENSIKAVDLIKLDIEGFEDQAYLGMRNMVKVSRKLILFLEFTRQSYDKPVEFYDKLRKDFSYIYTINEDGTLEDQGGKTYDALIGTQSSFIMLVLSKIELKK